MNIFANEMHNHVGLASRRVDAAGGKVWQRGLKQGRQRGALEMKFEMVPQILCFSLLLLLLLSLPQGFVLASLVGRGFGPSCTRYLKT